MGMRSWIAVLSAAALAVVAAPAHAAPDGPLADECRKASEALITPCYGADVLVRDVEATAAPSRHEPDIRAFEESSTRRALDFQFALAGDVGMVDAPWVGTHNSFNAIAEMGNTLSDTDSNQQLTLVDQLRLGVRSLELDVHWFPSASAGGARRPVVCHAEKRHEGCSVEPTLADMLPAVVGWLDRNPRQVLLLYVEDHLDASTGREAAGKVLREQLGRRLYAPQGGSCTELPDALTRDDILAAGAQVVIVSTCAKGVSWPGESTVFAWSAHGESRPVGYEDFPQCGPDFTREDYATRLIRYFEDSTWLNSAASDARQAERDEGLTPETTAAMLRCGVDLLGFDQLLPGDGRLDAAVWTWAEDEPRAGGDCALSRASDGRWVTGSCVPARPAACRFADGAWTVSKPTIAAHAGSACAREGATWAAPRTGHEQALLRATAGTETVLLGLRRDGATFHAVDQR